MRRERGNLQLPALCIELISLQMEPIHSSTIHLVFVNSRVRTEPVIIVDYTSIPLMDPKQALENEPLLYFAASFTNRWTSSFLPLTHVAVSLRDHLL